MSGHFRGPFIGETSDHKPYVECGWASAVNLANAATNGKFPHTAAEREALRVAGGGSDVTGASFAQLRLGMQKRYGFAGDITDGDWPTLRDGVRGSRWFVIFGYYNTLPAHFRRWQPGGAFLHATVAGPGDHVTAPWWYDPLSPDGYTGEPMALNTLQTFAASGGYSVMGITEGLYDSSNAPQVDLMPDTDLSANLYYGTVAKMPVDIPILDQPNGTEVAKTLRDEALGLIGQTRDALWCLVAYHDRLRFVEKKLVGEFRPRTPPIDATGAAFECPPAASTGYTKDQVAAMLERYHAGVLAAIPEPEVVP